jgi:hypothetical protein
MIAKGNTHDSGPKLVSYILTAQEGERVELGSARGFEFFGSDVLQAAAIMQQIADHTTNCRDAWFHTQTRLAPGEQLTREQWERVLDREEKRLGFTGHARAWSFHIDEATGERHLHAAWFRINPETNRAHDPGLFKLRLMEVSRWAEKEFGLRELSNERQPHDKAPTPERNEMEESRRLGTDVRAIRTAILDCFQQADSGKAFNAALEERGLMLANGDRRDCYVVVDQEGGQHALNKKLTGQTLAETRARLADLDRSQLPGVEQAQEIQRARQAEAQQRQPEKVVSLQLPEVAAAAPAEPAIATSAHTPAREPDAVRELASTADAAVDRGAHAGEGIFRSIGKLFSSFVSWIADSIAPPPPLTEQQVELKLRSDAERQEQQAIIAAQQEIEAQRDMLAEQQRTRDIARTQGLATSGDPEEDRFRSIMQHAARDRDRDREAERER